MNFLLTVNYPDRWYAIPAERRSDIVAATVAFHDKQLKAGKLKDTLTVADGRLMSIWNVASYQELVGILADHPYYGLVNWEPVPFLDHGEVVKVLADRRAAAAKAAKKK